MIFVAHTDIKKGVYITNLLGLPERKLQRERFQTLNHARYAASIMVYLCGMVDTKTGRLSPSRSRCFPWWASRDILGTMGHPSSMVVITDEAPPSVKIITQGKTSVQFNFTLDCLTCLLHCFQFIGNVPGKLKARHTGFWIARQNHNKFMRIV